MQIRIARSLVVAVMLSCCALVGMTVAQTAGADTSLQPGVMPTTPVATCHGRGAKACTPTPRPTCHGRGVKACPSTTSGSPTTTSSTTTPTETTTTTPSETTTTTPSGTTTTTPTDWSCVTSAPEGTCGPYAYAGITNSNGFNTYVTNHCWGDPTCQQTLSSNNPGQWQVVARQAAGNTSVRTYPNAQQLMNNWNGTGWGGCSQCTDTPISALTRATAGYSEATPRGGTIAQFAWDIWTNNNAGHPAEIMVWVDNSGRESGGATQVGTATIAGQDWTIYMYGDGELIWSLGAPGTFAQQGSGTVDLLAILHESIRQGFTSPAATIGQINAGWEICSTGGVDETFAVSRYTLTMAS